MWHKNRHDLYEIWVQEKDKGKVSVSAVAFSLSLRLIKTHRTDYQICVKYLISNMREFWGLAHCKYVIIHHPTCWNTIRQRGCVQGGGGLGVYLHVFSDLIISFYLNGTTATPCLYCERGNKSKHKKQKLFCDRREESAQQHLTASSEPNGGRSLIKF